MTFESRKDRLAREGMEDASIEERVVSLEGQVTVSETQTVTGNNVAVADNGSANLSWDTAIGDDLLDFSTIDVPTVKTDGMYAITTCVSVNSVTVGGIFLVELAVNSFSIGVIQYSPESNTANGGDIQIVVNMTIFLLAGSDIAVNVTSLDGASSRNYVLRQAIVSKL